MDWSIDMIHGLDPQCQRRRRRHRRSGSRDRRSRSFQGAQREEEEERSQEGRLWVRHCSSSSFCSYLYSFLLLFLLSISLSYFVSPLPVLTLFLHISSPLTQHFPFFLSYPSFSSLNPCLWNSHSAVPLDHLKSLSSYSEDDILKELEELSLESHGGKAKAGLINSDFWAHYQLPREHLMQIFSFGIFLKLSLNDLCGK